MPNLTNVNIKMPDGEHFLTAVYGGGIGPAPNNGLATNAATPGPNETFGLLVQDAIAGSFALKTAAGDFVTAVEAGGIGPSALPLNTDRTAPLAWETFGFNVISTTNPWTVQMQCANGAYVTAVNGGGIGDGGTNTTPIHTDANAIGKWEIFTINQPFIFNYLAFLFITTDDDLSGGTMGRGPSSLSATLSFSDGTSATLHPVNVDSSGKPIGFSNNSTNLCCLPLPKPVTADYIKSVSITLEQPPNNFPAGTDEWHLGYFSLVALQNPPASADVANPPPNPSVVLIRTGDPNGKSTNYVFTKSNPTVVWNIPDVQGNPVSFPGIPDL